MEMNQIRYFLAVCEYRNFTHAAKASNVSQPSLTAAIKKLEDELGGALFLRDRAGCSLTSLGKLVFPNLKNVLQEASEAKSGAIRHIKLERVPISIGIGETIGQIEISEAIERYRVKLPKSDIELIVDTQQALLEGVRDGRFDVAIVSIEPNADLYRVNPLYNEDYKVVVAKEHKLSQHKEITLGMLANTDLLDRLNCEMRDELHKTCSDNGHALYAAYRSNRVDWLLELARKGAGAIILPKTAIPNEASLVSLPIKDVVINRQIIAVRYRHQPSRPEIDELLRQFLQKA